MSNRNPLSILIEMVEATAQRDSRRLRRLDNRYGKIAPLIPETPEMREYDLCRQSRFNYFKFN